MSVSCLRRSIRDAASLLLSVGLLGCEATREQDASWEASEAGIPTALDDDAPDAAAEGGSLVAMGEAGASGDAARSATPDSATSPADPGSDAAVSSPLDAAGIDASDAAQPDAALARDAALVDASWPQLEAAQIGAPTRVAGGYGLAESPLWDPCQHALLFPDVNASVIHRLGSDGKITPFMTNTNYTNGMAFERDGSLLLAQMGGGRGGRLVRRARDGSSSVLSDKDPRGNALHTVDDVVVRSDGTVYFTDGDFPHGAYLGFTLSALPVFILAPGTRTLVEGHTVSGPNGVELSPDEQTLYLSSYFGDRIVQLKVAADGSLSAPSVFAMDLTSSDSLCLDAAGNVYSAVSAGLQVLRPDGSRVKLIPIASLDGTTNCGFGGEDGKTLYITSWTDLWQVQGMPIPGLDWQNNQRLPCTP